MRWYAKNNQTHIESDGDVFFVPSGSSARSDNPVVCRTTIDSFEPPIILVFVKGDGYGHSLIEREYLACPSFGVSSAEAEIYHVRS